jgi:xanthine dehydrogenase accessory factor
MVVGPEDQSGSIGGGNLERIAADQARRMLATPGGPAWAVQDYPLGPLLAQCCGGRVRLLIERLGPTDQAWLAEARRFAAEDKPFRRRLRLGEGDRCCALAPDDCAAGEAITLNGRPAGARGERPAAGDEISLAHATLRPRLALFGAGHVGRALTAVLASLPFRVSWYDSRAEAAAPGLVIAGPEDLVRIAGADREHVLVMTHDHALDYALVAAALRGATPHVGLIGSKTKKARFLSRLRAEGLDEAALGRLLCPIGLSGLAGKAPEIIAVAVAADLLIRRQAAQPAAAREAALAGL